MCPEKAELSTTSQRSRLSPMKISGDLSSVATEKKQQSRLQKQFLRGGRKLAPCYPGVAFPTLCHPMATGLLYKGSWETTEPSFKCYAPYHSFCNLKH